MAAVDVTVRGAGIFGLSVGWACLRRGARVRLVDPYGPGKGASEGLVGALAPHVPENWNDKKQFQFESLLMAEAFWHEVEQVSGLASGYARKGRLQPVANERGLALARAREDTAGALWQGKAVWRITGAEAFPGWAPSSPTGLVVHDTLTARIAPRAACAALAQAIRARGGEIVTEAPEQGRTVWATGAAGLAALSADLGREVGSAIKGQSALLALDARDMPQIFADAVHIVPHADGTVAVGSTSERDFASPDRTDELLDAVLTKAIAICPVLAEARVLERWAGLRPRARSRAPMLGKWPGREGHFIANGGFKIGFGIAPKVGEVMADLVLDGTAGIPAGFRVEANL